ncbi:MAG: zf-HC2 domain-containing protein [Acidobacteria bacterium]|jgi:hypothetical protein|nr:zf-HC2 domain-containing protein [Acidobacteriota bacterium]
MQCRDFREVADSYLSDELLIETNHDVIAHLEACADCRRELAARRELRATLRASFESAAELQIDNSFAAHLRAQLRATALNQASKSISSNRAWLAVAACLLVAFTFGLVLVRHRLQSPTGQRVAIDKDNSNNTEAKQPAPQPRADGANAAVNIVMRELTRFAVGNHRNCAVKFNLPEAPIDIEAAGLKYDRAYINLKQTVTNQLAASSASMEFVEAHSCVFEGRRFAHLVLRQNGRLVSFLITNLDAKETAIQRTQAKTDINEQVIACSQIEGYQVSCFETARHAVFVVSDLSEAGNLNVARSLAPIVYKHLSQAEGIA